MRGAGRGLWMSMVPSDVDGSINDVPSFGSNANANSAPGTSDPLQSMDEFQLVNDSKAWAVSMGPAVTVLAVLACPVHDDSCEALNGFSVHDSCPMRNGGMACVTSAATSASNPRQPFQSFILAPLRNSFAKWSHRSVQDVNR